ncbi:Nudix hydrolase 11 [Geodia barretti]|uniref:Nudix hydrolase 11 n=1 Tax=Geodia barretti TaxID=519541 RepID=A0AA35RMB6_GEOBA|nr:Nudix hydrolase 11 [Geodia barretti]
MSRQENSSYRDVRDMFRRAEAEGWFFPWENNAKYPLSMSSRVDFEGGAGLPPAGQPRYKEAAVLFLMGCKARSTQLQVLITKRSMEVTSHPGEYCLPGGMHDSTTDTTLVDTALREAREEVGVSRDSVEVLCSLPPFLSGWHHTTAVGVVPGLLCGDIEGLEIRENRREVEHTTWIPLRHFIVGDYHRQMRGAWRGLPSSISSFYLPPSTDSGGHPRVVWGLTAAICTGVSSIALGELQHYPSYCSAISKIDDKYVHMSELAHTSQLYRDFQKSKL